MSDIKKIVLTGGPCAGKTTALVKVIEHFSSLGYKVFTIPEVPTLFSQSGMDYLTHNQNFFYEGEKATLAIQLDLEDRFMTMAQQLDQPTIIICDRGAMDISAYMQPSMWEDITAKMGTSTQQLKERYDAILHLVSAADGAEAYYTTANNNQRKEGLELARELDKKVINA
ncbi:MAG: ATP-binding protein, partial [Prevotella sp.]|nr:ATP-binding protein [Prevotella sp.]